MEQQAEDMVLFMNSLLKVDPRAISALVLSRVPCNNEMLEHPTVTVSVEEEVPMVGLLGILNGILGIREKGCRIGVSVQDDLVLSFHKQKAYPPENQE